MSAVAEVNRGYVQVVRNRTRSGPILLLRSLLLATLRLLLLPLLLLAGVAVSAHLRRKLSSRRSKTSDFYRRALNNIEPFITQYPLHLYPIVCKAFELAHVQDELEGLMRKDPRIVEIAIGEGSFSARIFPKDAGVVGLDLDPYMLRQARKRGHVKACVVTDCLEPAVKEGCFDLLVANNFLHHVTEKEKTLVRWTQISERLLFNENTVFWSSSWFLPYVLERLGWKSWARARVNQIERKYLQSLWTRECLDAVIREECDIIRSVSYMSARTFFFCAMFSFFMARIGPPTPPFLKRLFLGPLRGAILPLTRRLAELLIRSDEYEDRHKDSYVSYTCTSKSFRKAEGEGYLACPMCRSDLDLQDRCVGCGVLYTSADGMLFLLPAALSHIQQQYDGIRASMISPEQL